MPRPKMGLQEFIAAEAPASPREGEATSDEPAPIRQTRGTAGRVKASERAAERRKVKEIIKADFKARGEKLGATELEVLWLRELSSKELLTPGQKRKLEEAEGYESRMVAGRCLQREATTGSEGSSPLASVDRPDGDGEGKELREQLEAAKLALEEAKQLKRDIKASDATTAADVAAKREEMRLAEAARKAAAAEMAELKAAFKAEMTAHSDRIVETMERREQQLSEKRAAAEDLAKAKAEKPKIDAFRGFTEFSSSAVW